MSEDMSARKSQIVLPVNPITLFTSLVGFIVVSLIGWMATEVGEWSDAADGIKAITARLEKQDAVDAKQNNVIVEHSQRLQSIEDTRFRKEDADRLQRDIVDRISQQIQISVQPVAENARRNGEDLRKLDAEMEELKFRERIK